MELEVENKIKNINQIIENSIKTEDPVCNEIDYNVTAEKQNNFLETTLGKTINNALNIGLKYLLPNIIDDQIIEIKDTIIKEGFKQGLNKTISSAIDLGKSVTGLVTGKFDNVSQMQTVIAKGGLVDTLSDCIDFGLKVAKQAGVPPQVVSIIKSGKNILMNNIESNIESTLTTQLKGIEKVNEYIDNWNAYYKQQNFPKMELEYDKIRTKLKDLAPIEETLTKAHQVENLHKLIKSNGRNFDLSNEEIELAKKL